MIAVFKLRVHPTRQESEEARIETGAVLHCRAVVCSLVPIWGLHTPTVSSLMAPSIKFASWHLHQTTCLVFPSFPTPNTDADIGKLSDMTHSPRAAHMCSYMFCYMFCRVVCSWLSLPLPVQCSCFPATFCVCTLPCSLWYNHLKGNSFRRVGPPT